MASDAPLLISAQEAGPNMLMAQPPFAPSSDSQSPENPPSRPAFYTVANAPNSSSVTIQVEDPDVVEAPTESSITCSCNQCRKEIRNGMTYKCKVCKQTDFCEECQKEYVEHWVHKFTEIPYRDLTNEYYYKLDGEASGPEFDKLSQKEDLSAEEALILGIQAWETTSLWDKKEKYQIWTSQNDVNLRTQAINFFKRTVLEKHPIANTYLGWAYLCGMGDLTKSVKDALLHFEIAAKPDASISPSAFVKKCVAESSMILDYIKGEKVQDNTGWLRTTFLPLDGDTQKSLAADFNLQQHADNDDSWAWIALGMIADVDERISKYEKSLSLGNLNAAVLLGQITYFEGEKPDADPAKSYDYYNQGLQGELIDELLLVAVNGITDHMMYSNDPKIIEKAIALINEHKHLLNNIENERSLEERQKNFQNALKLFNERERSSNSHPDSIVWEDRSYQSSRDYTLRQIPGPKPWVGAHFSGHKTEIEAVRITADGKYAVSMSWTPLDAVKIADGKLKISASWTLPDDKKDKKPKSYATLCFWKIDCENREIIPLTKDPIIVKDSLPLYDIWKKETGNINLSISANGMMASICSIASDDTKPDSEGNSNTATSVGITNASPANVPQANAPQANAPQANAPQANIAAANAPANRPKRSKQVYICGVHEEKLPKKEFIGVGFFIAGKELFAHITDTEKNCRLYDTKTWEQTSIIRLQDDKAAFSIGRLLPRMTPHIWCFYEATSILVDLGSTNPTETRFEPEFKDLVGLCVSPNGKWLASFRSTEIFVYQISSGLKVLYKNEYPDRTNDVVTVQFSPDESQMFVLWESENKLKIYDLDVQQSVQSNLQYSDYEVPRLSIFGRQNNFEDFVVSPTSPQQGNSLTLTPLSEFKRSTNLTQVDSKTIFWGFPHMGLQIGSFRVDNSADRSDWDVSINVNYKPKDATLQSAANSQMIRDLEPWIDYSSLSVVHMPSQFACYAIDGGERYVLVGSQNFQLRGFKCTETESSNLVEYVWAAPRLDDAALKQREKEPSNGNPTVLKRKCIKSSMMYVGKVHKDDDETLPKLYVLRIVFTDNTSELIPLPVYTPDDQDYASCELVAKHACEFLSYCADLRKYVVQKNNPEGMIYFFSDMQSFLGKIISSYPNVFFNGISDKTKFKRQHFPLESIIKLEMESLLESAITKLDDGSLEYVPDFYEDINGQKKTAFMQFIFEHRKGPWMRSLLKYLEIKFLSDGKTGWFCTVNSNLLELSELYPQEYTKFMRKISYINVQSGNYFLKNECQIQKGKEETTEHPEFFGYGGYINSLVKNTHSKRGSSEKKNPDTPRWPFGIGATTAKHRPKNSKSYRMVSLYPVPLPNFGSYPKPETKGLRKYWHYLIPLRSCFADLALRGSPEVFGEPVMEAIIQYKWRNFAQTRYWLVQALYLIYAIAFFILTGLTQINDNSFGFQTDLGTRAGLGFCALLTLLIGWLYIAQELRQISELCLRGQWFDYPASVYNWLDWCSFALPGAYSVLALIALFRNTPSAEAPNWLAPYGLLSMYFRFIMLLRVQELFGTFVATVINSFVSVSSFLVLLIVIVIGFAHALFLLLRSELAAPSIYGGSLLQVQTNATLGSLNLSQSNNNYFNAFSTALRSVYFFLGGDFSPLQNFSDTSLDFMKVIFYASTSIFMFNILIALLSNAVNSTSEQGRKIWLFQMANVISEVEMFWMVEFERHNSAYFPSVIFYESDSNKSQEYNDITAKDDADDPIDTIKQKVQEIQETQNTQKSDDFESMKTKMSEISDMLTKLAEKLDSKSPSDSAGDQPTPSNDQPVATSS